MGGIIVGMFLEEMCLGMLTQFFHISYVESGAIRMILVTHLVQEVHLFHAEDMKFVTS